MLAAELFRQLPQPLLPGQAFERLSRVEYFRLLALHSPFSVFEPATAF
jgi:hypothetical protein